jgi:hypothetical protein
MDPGSLLEVEDLRELHGVEDAAEDRIHSDIIASEQCLLDDGFEPLARAK